MYSTIIEVVTFQFDVKYSGKQEIKMLEAPKDFYHIWYVTKVNTLCTVNFIITHFRTVFLEICSSKDRR